MILVLLVLGSVTALADVTISSPLAPPPPNHNLTLTTPVVPAPGLILGWAGGSGADVSGSVEFNFGPKNWQPLSFDLLSMNGLKTEALGIFVPASKVLAAVGIALPAGSIWATLAAAVGGGPFVGYDTDTHKIAYGGYYRADVLQVNF